MPVSAKVIVPKELLTQPRKVRVAIRNALQMSVEAGKIDFEVTTQTWSHSVNFRTQVGETKGKVWTDDEVYLWVNNGTRPHVIVPRRAARLVFKAGGFRAKTVPGAIRSRKGARGKNTVFATKVFHPGTEARKFDEVIQKKWLNEFPKQVQMALDSAIES